MNITPFENWIVDRTGLRERSREALERYQLEKIRETILYARENCEFYSRLLKKIDAYQIYSISDFQHMPFTFPHDISKNPNSFLCVPQSRVKRIVTLKSSGTSGEEKRIFFTEEDLNCTIDFFKAGMGCLVDETDRVLILLPGSAYGSIGDLLKKALSMLKIECIVYGVLSDPIDAARCIEDKGITCIVGIPIQVLHLSRTQREVFKKKYTEGPSQH